MRAGEDGVYGCEAEAFDSLRWRLGFGLRVSEFLEASHSPEVPQPLTYIPPIVRRAYELIGFG